GLEQRDAHTLRRRRRRQASPSRKRAARQALELRAIARRRVRQAAREQRWRRAGTPSPDLVVNALPEQPVGSGRTHGRGVATREDQGIGGQRRRRELLELDGIAVGGAACCGELRWRIEEARPGDIKAAQHVQRVFVVVGEEGGAAPGEAAVERRELVVARRWREVRTVILQRI